MAEAAVDQTPQNMFGNADLAGQPSYRQAFLPPDLTLLHRVVEGIEGMAVRCAEVGFRRGLHNEQRRHAKQRRRHSQKDCASGEREDKERRRACRSVPCGLDSQTRPISTPDTAIA